MQFCLIKIVVVYKNTAILKKNRYVHHTFCMFYVRKGKTKNKT